MPRSSKDEYKADEKCWYADEPEYATVLFGVVQNESVKKPLSQQQIPILRFRDSRSENASKSTQLAKFH
jgi:hypothetical protein